MKRRAEFIKSIFVGLGQVAEAGDITAFHLVAAEAQDSVEVGESASLQGAVLEHGQEGRREVERQFVRHAFLAKTEQHFKER